MCMSELSITHESRLSSQSRAHYLRDSESTSHAHNHGCSNRFLLLRIAAAVVPECRRPHAFYPSCALHAPCDMIRSLSYFLRTTTTHLSPCPGCPRGPCDSASLPSPRQERCQTWMFLRVEGNDAMYGT